MATADITIKGTDQSAGAVNSARENLKRLRQEKIQLNNETKVLNSTFNSFGSLVSSIGGGLLGGMVQQIESVVINTRKMEAGLKSSTTALLGIAAAGAAAGVALGSAIGDVIESKAEEKLKDQIKLKEIIQTAQMETLAIVNKEAAAQQAINNSIDARAQQLLRMKNISTGEFIKAADALNKLRETNRVAQVAQADQEIARRRSESNEIYMQAEKLVKEFDDKMRAMKLDADLRAIDKQIEVEQQARQMREQSARVDFEVEQQRQAESMQGFFQMVQARQELWNNSLLNMRDATYRFAAAAAFAISDGIGNAVANIATGAQSASEAFKEFGRSLIAMLVKTAVQLVVNSVLAVALQGAISAAATAMAAVVASAWAAPAALVSLATFGSNAAPATAALVSTVGVAQGLALGGKFHSGMDYVPAEGSYLLSRGERIIQPTANEALTEFLEGGGGGGQMINITLNLDGAPLYRAMGRASRDGRLNISAKAVS